MHLLHNKISATGGESRPTVWAPASSVSTLARDSISRNSNTSTSVFGMDERFPVEESEEARLFSWPSCAPREGDEVGQGGRGPSGAPWGVVARICCIELISFIQSLISFIRTSFSFIRLLFSLTPTLVSFLRRLFSFMQTAADIDSWLLWIGGGGAWSWVWVCGLVGGRGEGTGRGTGTPHLYLFILDLSSSWKAALLNSCRLDGLASG